MIKFILLLCLIHVFFLGIRKMVVGNEKPWDDRRFFPIIGIYFCIYDVITHVTVKRFFPKSYYISEEDYKSIIKSRANQLVDCTYEHFINVYTVNPSKWYVEEKSMISYQDRSNRYYMNFSYADYRKAIKFVIEQRTTARDTENEIARFQRSKLFLESVQSDLDKKQKSLAEEQMEQMRNLDGICKRIKQEDKNKNDRDCRDLF